ncbi:hypothetical protein VOI54_02755 [Tamlana sp. 2201CG12-4]|uniref:hypothetical protein n=1 Tax=Tamlana sp. 2201CG12-4 TaxID=3112582 RepID=UPI002DBD4F9D|nr:hypothetical protein [Tamlana sp. 2201CG12-4]MEC3905931.1 hypothetical protein [Tamlana sp. 2201CG12-4]
MRIQILALVSLFVLTLSCKNKQESNSTAGVEVNKSQEITEQEISKLKYIDYALDEKTEDAIEDWAQYRQLRDVIDDVKEGDLSFFNDNEKAIKLLLKELKDDIPETIASSSILARILVVETKFYKLESLSNLSTTSKEELLEAIQEFLVSFSNLNLQMNKKIEFDTRTIERP